MAELFYRLASAIKVHNSMYVSHKNIFFHELYQKKIVLLSFFSINFTYAFMFYYTLSLPQSLLLYNMYLHIVHMYTYVNFVDFFFSPGKQVWEL